MIVPIDLENVEKYICQYIQCCYFYLGKNFHMSNITQNARHQDLLWTTFPRL